jgi:hypothetical protein
VLVSIVADYLDQSRELLDDWHGASPSGDGPLANPPAAWHG